MTDEKVRNNDIYWYLLNKKQTEIRLCQIFNVFRQKNIEPILIKGWTIARFYPNFSRISSDIDIAVAPEDFADANNLIKEPEFANLNVDLHKGLRHLDKTDWNDLFECSKLVEIEGEPIRILSEEDNLRVICVHWLNDGGANKERLWDIFYSVENRSDSFDWDKFLNQTGTKRRKWLVCSLGLTRKYLGLNLKNTPIDSEAEGIPNWVVKALEKEWNDEVKLLPLTAVKNDKKKLLQQIKKRIPPNPIQATIEVEGSFDNKPRIIFQVADIFRRAYISIGKYLENRKEYG